MMYLDCAACGVGWGWHPCLGGFAMRRACDTYREPSTPAEVLKATADDDGTTRCEDYLICPHCGYRHENMYEWDSDDCEAYDDTYECEGCEKTFEAQRYTTVKYEGRLPANAT